MEIPAQVIEDLKRKYGCSQEEAVSAFVAASARASAAFNEAVEEHLSPPPAAEPPPPPLLTPSAIKTHLDRYVIGQEEYKKRICIATAYHFALVRALRQEASAREKINVKRFRKKNTIIAGPSGSGKTYCAEVLGDLLKVPTLIIDSTDYTEAGYVGKSADDMIRELIDLAPGANRREQARFVAMNGGIIFIDEIDKKAKDAGPFSGHDISREGFQRSVLKLMERKLVPINNPYSAVSQMEELAERGRHRPGSEQDRMIATDNILFILGGSFERTGENLSKIIRKRVESHGHLTEEGDVIVRGFEEAGHGEGAGDFRNYYREALAEDYIRFGLLPELVGRAPIRTFVDLLSKNDLIRIMRETEDSILQQYRLEFSLFDIRLDFSDEAVEYVAEQAENKKTGARALVSVWENILTDFQFELPGSEIRSLLVTRALCERPMDALLSLMERSPFEDAVRRFEQAYGIRLAFDEDIQKHIRRQAAERGQEVAALLKELLDRASALNYMDVASPLTVTREMVDDPTYYDRLFADWYSKQKGPHAGGSDPSRS